MERKRKRRERISLSPSKVKFTQDSVALCFKKGRPLNEVCEEIARGVLSADDFPNVRVLVRDGNYYGVDNRRLYIFRVLCKLGILRAITVCKFDEFDREITTDNDGCHVRIRNQKDNNGKWIRAVSYSHCSCEDQLTKAQVPEWWDQNMKCHRSLSKIPIDAKFITNERLNSFRNKNHISEGLSKATVACSTSKMDLQTSQDPKVMQKSESNKKIQNQRSLVYRQQENHTEAQPGRRRNETSPATPNQINQPMGPQLDQALVHRNKDSITDASRRQIEQSGPPKTSIDTIFSLSQSIYDIQTRQPKGYVNAVALSLESSDSESDVDVHSATYNWKIDQQINQQLEQFQGVPRRHEAGIAEISRRQQKQAELPKISNDAIYSLPKSMHGNQHRQIITKSSNNDSDIENYITPQSTRKQLRSFNEGSVADSSPTTFLGETHEANFLPHNLIKPDLDNIQVEAGNKISRTRHGSRSYALRRNFSSSDQFNNKPSQQNTSVSSELPFAAQRRHLPTATVMQANNYHISSGPAVPGNSQVSDVPTAIDTMSKKKTFSGCLRWITRKFCCCGVDRDSTERVQ
ncbi:unnamed protein product [Clavelina lepadiformis]|uniref:Uncharacterized protein n=1 Tax=Clavelina lepadiformis TaxID=159417 RepID=A0ABP0FL51_CLALP